MIGGVSLRGFCGRSPRREKQDRPSDKKTDDWKQPKSGMVDYRMPATGPARRGDVGVCPLKGGTVVACHMIPGSYIHKVWWNPRVFFCLNYLIVSRFCPTKSSSNHLINKFSNIS